MRPQTLTYGNGDDVVRLDGTNTFLVHVSKLGDVAFFTPTVFVEGIEEEKVKFDFHKAYTNSEGEVLHCEYRNINGKEYKLIVHTQ